jgi:hypothetical protein
MGTTTSLTLDSNLSVLKVVQADYNPTEHGDNPQRYCGWVAMHPGSLIDLWIKAECAKSVLFDIMWSRVPGTLWESE